ncbi:MAG: RNA polymerase factor sigma-54 [Candidatus Omnitrophota bacterium]
MALEFRQTQKQLQKLLLTPQMQQSLYILQLPMQELRTLITMELENNPVLEEIEGERSPGEEKDSSEPLPRELQQMIDEDENWKEYISQRGDTEAEQEQRAYRESLVTKPPSPREDLSQQLAVTFPNDAEVRRIGDYILGNLDESGYLESSVAEIAETLKTSRDKVERILKALQRFEPVGIASRDLRECLLIQLEQAGEKDTLAYRIADKYLAELGRKRYAPITKALGSNLKAVKEAHQRIGRLEPRPGRAFSRGQAAFLTPDLLVTQKEGRYELTFVNEGFPSIRINPLYKKLIKEKSSAKEAREFLKEKLKEAITLIRCLNQRRETIAKVARVVIEFQKEFLEKGPEYLKPLTLKDVAAVLDCHESTVSRVVMNKVIETPHGCFPLKHFFDRSAKTEDGESLVGSKSVMALIESWVRAEDPKHPLSDQEIVERLKREGLTVARRTAAKYRTALKILPSYLRKK